MARKSFFRRNTAVVGGWEGGRKGTNTDTTERGEAVCSK